jgi:hypothetical protein
MPVFVASLFRLAGTCSGCDPVWQETRVRQSRPRVQGEQFDLKESDPSLVDEFAAADRLAERKVGNVPRNKNFIFAFWRAKKVILAKSYGIRWKSPAELSPGIEYEGYGQPKITASERELVRLALAKQMDAAESLIFVWREFVGKIYATTKSSTDKTVRIYNLTGQPEKWQIAGPYVLAID